MSIKVTNLKSLNKKFDKIANRVGVSVTTLQKKLAFDIFAGIVADTPVDTGRAMNGWNISVGSPNHETPDSGGTPGSIQGSKEGQAATEMAGLQPFSTVWISNALPYIVSLNEGSSNQAPASFVERNIQNELGTLKKVL